MTAAAAEVEERALAADPIAAPRDQSSRRAAADPVTATAAVILAAVAALALWVVVFAVWVSALPEHHDQHVLYAAFRQQLARQTAPVGGAVAPGRPVALLSGPHLGRQVVVAGTTSDQLRSGPGLLPTSVLPGQAGAAVVLGRSTTFGAPFGGLDSLRVGDRLTTVTGVGTSTFTVVGNQLAGAPAPARWSAAHAGIRLLTADRGGLAGVPTPSRTRVVYAVLDGSPTVAEPSTGGSRADLPMAWRSLGLFPLVLWLQLLVVVALVLAWVGARARRLRTQAWLLVVPVGAAALYGASSALFGVLPNLL